MSTFKFACPYCGQHLNVDTDQAGAQMQCPTCFQNIIIPQGPEEGESKFVLTGAKLKTRVLPTIPDVGPLPPPPKSRYPYAAIAFVVVLCVTLVVGFIFRNKLFKRPSGEEETQPVVPTMPAQPAWTMPERPEPPVVADTSWRLDLTDATIPTNEFAGRINGVEFTNRRVYLQGGTLEFREGSDWPPSLGLSIRLYARRGEELSGKTIVIKPDAKRQPEVVLRWWDSNRQSKSEMITNGYALRLEFGRVVNREMPGKIYLCTPDEYRSWLAGEFQARVRGPRRGDLPGDPP